jgi:copper chaperone
MSLTFKRLEGVRFRMSVGIGRHSRKGPTMAEQKKMAVKGMTCTGCEQRVTTALDALAGVEEASADHEAGTVTMRLDPTMAGEKVVRGAIEELGYRVVA